MSRLGPHLRNCSRAVTETHVSNSMWLIWILQNELIAKFTDFTHAWFYTCITLLSFFKADILWMTNVVPEITNSTPKIEIKRNVANVTTAAAPTLSVLFGSFHVVPADFIDPFTLWNPKDNMTPASYDLQRSSETFLASSTSAATAIAGVKVSSSLFIVTRDFKTDSLFTSHITLICNASCSGL